MEQPLSRGGNDLKENVLVVPQCPPKDPSVNLLRFGYLGKWSPCAYESLSTKGEEYYPYTLLYDSKFILTWEI